MIYLPSHMRVFLAPGSTDMRKAINSLSILVEDTLRPDPFSGHLFVFCNRGNLIETAKTCGLDPYQYLRLLFEKIPHAHTESDYKALLPENVAADLPARL